MVVACGNGNNITSGNNVANTSGHAEGPEKTSKLKVGYAVPDQTMPFFSRSIEDLKEFVEKEQGGELLVASAGMDVNKQINNIENLLASRIQVLVVCPVEPKALEDSLKKAQEAGIKVVGLASDELKNVDTILTASNKMMGTLVGERISKWINEKLGGNAEVGLMLLTTNSGLTERGIALEEAIKKNSPNVKIVSKQEALSVADAQKVAENMLTANPNMQVIAAIEDYMALGAYEAAKAAGRAKGDFLISGSGGIPEVLAKMKETGSVLRVTLDMGAESSKKSLVDSILKLYKGEPVEKLQYSKLTVVDQSNIDKFVK
jgi:ribose transport system substrate-binding protein